MQSDSILRSVVIALVMLTWSFLAHAMASPATDPGARAGAAMALDPRTGAIVLFGGFTQQNGEEVQLADTWSWRNGCWTRLDAEGPTARSWATLTFDPKARAMMLFGGKVDNTEAGTFGDTWRLRRDRWTRIETSPSPPPRAHHAAAWDAAADRLVIFGGSQGSDLLGDAWSWSSDQWSPIKAGDGPEARALHIMYFDPRQGGLVVHGGSSNPWPPVNLSDRWVLKAEAFRRLPSGPARAYHVGGVLREGTLLSMGWSFEANPVVASWLRDDETWRRLDDPANGPVPRAGAASAIDTAAGVLYIYGGMNSDFEPQEGLWRFDGAEWSLLQGCR